MLTHLLQDTDYDSVPEDIQIYLNGGANKAIRESNPIAALRNSGIFFTGQNIARKLLSLESPNTLKDKTVYDPCCGVGDLLLMASHSFPIGKTLDVTLRDWGERLFGNDQINEFVELTKIRIILAALNRGARPDIDISTAKQHLHNISCADTLVKDFKYPEVNIILLNPPYSKTVSELSNPWATGSVSQAAIYLERMIRSASTGVRVLAILPDVLRAGSRYDKWRYLINKIGAPKQIKIIGRFDEHTDVDVFIGKFIVGNIQEKKTWWSTNGSKETHTKLGELFNVSVGPVVPYRDPKRGTNYLYVTAKDIRLWGKEIPKKKRKFQGTVFTPPFVVIKRTSSPADKYRAGASVITGKHDVAVENHLIVLSPKDRLLVTCEEILKSLQNKKTNDWLNERIRCRHLTVAAIKEMPWWKK